MTTPTKPEENWLKRPKKSDYKRPSIVLTRRRALHI